MSGQHGAQLRGLELAPGSALVAGRFGRMFRNLPVRDHGIDQLEAFAASMVAPADPEDTAPVPDPAPEDDEENPNLPAGYTYLGQLIDHDITFDPVSSLQSQNDPDALHDFRTPRLDLDNLYGRGPDDQPYLYNNGPAADPHPTLGFDQRGVMFRLGALVADAGDPGQALVSGPDLPRTSDGRAIIGDPRNDENIIVSQLQSLMLRFHNRMAEHTFQRTSIAFTDALLEAGIAGSIGTVGDALENALMESTIGLYKTELIDWHDRTWTGRSEVNARPPPGSTGSTPPGCTPRSDTRPQSSTKSNTVKPPPRPPRSPRWPKRSLRQIQGGSKPCGRSPGPVARAPVEHMVPVRSVAPGAKLSSHQRRAPGSAASKRYGRGSPFAPYREQLVQP